MADEPLSLDTVCKHCGLTLREHCTSKDGRLWYRACAAKLRTEHPDHWPAETGTADGEFCILCGWSVQEHYHWRALQFNVMGTLIVPEKPCAMETADEFIGCVPGDDEPDETTAGASA